MMHATRWSRSVSARNTLLCAVYHCLDSVAYEASRRLTFPHFLRLRIVLLHLLSCSLSGGKN